MLPVASPGYTQVVQYALLPVTLRQRSVTILYQRAGAICIGDAID
jgi:hypothetical protein